MKIERESERQKRIILAHCKETKQSVKTFFRKNLDCYNVGQVDGFLNETQDFGSLKIGSLIDVINKYNATK
tara:strand:+ start:1360 stop:1572 length:213 start_codon:yes stop_codon:yes gene_type:complete